MRKVAPVLLLALVAMAAQADESEQQVQTAQVSAIVRGVSDAFARKMGVVNERGEQASALDTSLFPSWGFTPRTYPRVSWTLTGVSEEEARLCVKVSVPDKTSWGSAVSALSAGGLKLSGADCIPGAGGALPLSKYPGQVSATLKLLRSNVATANAIPKDPEIDGVSKVPGAAGLRIVGALPATFSITNTPKVTVVNGVEVPRTLSISAASVSPGFEMSDDCPDLLGSGDVCFFNVHYTGDALSASGKLVVSFSNGAVLVTSVHGAR